MMLLSLVLVTLSLATQLPCQSILPRRNMGKGKGKTDLSSFSNLSAEELHSIFLNHLYTSQDYEAGLVNLMKERYDVIFKTL